MNAGGRDDEDEAEVENAIKIVTIEGLGYLDVLGMERSAKAIVDVRDALRNSDMFSDETEIARRPSPRKNESTRSFRIEIHLEEPIEL